MAKHLSDGKLKVFAGWTGASSMAGVHVHLGGRDLDADLLEIAGVDVTSEKEESPLKVKECTRCHTRNQGTAEFCTLCGRPFNEIPVIEQVLDQQKLQDEIESLREGVQQTEGVGQYLNSLQTQIEQLQRQLAELRPQQYQTGNP